MKIAFLVGVFFLFFLLEVSVTTLPLILIFFLVTSVLFRNEVIFIPAAITGIFLDVLTMRTIGYTSVFFLVFLFLLFLYERKFETASYQFILCAGFFGTFIYGLYIQAPFALFAAILCSIIGLFLFAIEKRIIPGMIRKS